MWKYTAPLRVTLSEAILGLQSWIRKIDSSRIGTEKFFDPGRTNSYLDSPIASDNPLRQVTLVILGGWSSLPSPEVVKSRS
jgi:hypothetical protein